MTAPEPHDIAVAMWREIRSAADARIDGDTISPLFYQRLRGYLDTLDNDEFAEFLEAGAPT